MAEEASDAKSKLKTLEAQSQAVALKSSEDRASYEKEVGAAKKRISELEDSLGSAKVAAQAAAQSAIEVRPMTHHATLIVSHIHTFPWFI